LLDFLYEIHILDGDMSHAIKPTPEQKRFGTEVGAKLYNRYRSSGPITVSEVSQAVSAMVQFKLAKEGWTKEDPTAALELDVER
jgi:hypothetical protein